MCALQLNNNICGFGIYAPHRIRDDEKKQKQNVLAVRVRMRTHAHTLGRSGSLVSIFYIVHAVQAH